MVTYEERGDPVVLYTCENANSMIFYLVHNLDDAWDSVALTARDTG